eukprot:6180266-Pleurochrysis_carterae.AAC.1
MFVLEHNGRGQMRTRDWHTQCSELKAEQQFAYFRDRECRGEIRNQRYLLELENCVLILLPYTSRSESFGFHRLRQTATSVPAGKFDLRGSRQTVRASRFCASRRQ